MQVRDVLADAFGRVQEVVHGVLDGADDALLSRPPPGAAAGNPIGWLVWHLARVQDDHVADAFGAEQVWVGGGWAQRFGLELPVADTGYGHGPRDVAAVAAPAALLRGYFDAVHAATLEHLRGAGAAELDRVVDSRWDPPVTLAVRLVSVLADDLQHAGQAAYLRGLLEAGYDGPE